jgi:hypothetical protein
MECVVENLLVDLLKLFFASAIEALDEVEVFNPEMKNDRIRSL